MTNLRVQWNPFLHFFRVQRHAKVFEGLICSGIHRIYNGILVIYSERWEREAIMQILEADTQVSTLVYRVCTVIDKETDLLYTVSIHRAERATNLVIYLIPP